MEELAARVDELDSAAEYVVYCEQGDRSAAACRFLSLRGFPNLRNLGLVTERTESHWRDVGMISDERADGFSPNLALA